MSSTISSEEVILVSPQLSFSTKRRRITPSNEASLTNRLLVVSPTSPVQPQPLRAPPTFSSSSAEDLFPNARAIIELRRPLHLPHGHPNTCHSSPETQPNLPISRQIRFPFDLHNSPAKFFDRANTKLLLDIFPSAQGVDFDERMLIYHFQTLPPKPWPKKVAGVPCYLTDDEQDLGPFARILRRRSRSRITISDHLDLRDNEPAAQLIFDLVKDFYERESIPITEIQFWETTVIIVLDMPKDNDDVLYKVPRSVGQCNCFCLYEEEMGRPRTLPAFRMKPASPNNGKIDNSRYETLRPGVILSSGKHTEEEGSEILSSSGVLIKNRSGGVEFITAAAHGIPGSPYDGNVYHPSHAGAKVGQIIKEVTHTDVALVRLEEGVKFINEPFENTVTASGPFNFIGLARAAETKIGANIYLDSPFSGFLEGTRLSHSYMRVPTNDPLGPEQKWIRCQWNYMGQGSQEAMVDGICGSAIWEDNRNVIGFSRYAPASGLFADYCLSISADCLLDEGYSIV
ncbi:hypothetical protein BJX61DRAFT_316587 [Aspergillus egyptiacus]|nr:hypothetical protein BJX61DRAFT_316587 [Aspergillus egyptiacus]